MLLPLPVLRHIGKWSSTKTTMWVCRHSMRAKKQQRMPIITPAAAMRAGSKRRQNCKWTRKRCGQKRQQHRTKAKGLPQKKEEFTGFLVGNSGRKSVRTIMQVPYEYKIFHTKLKNRGLEVVIREELTEDQWQRYQIFQDTLGGRPYLFNGGLPPGGSDGSGEAGIDYTVPAEALTDSEFAAIYGEAKKYVGTPYVWGGSTPETGFDCSGYVCWVYNQNGYDVGRATANGLWQKSQHISEAEAKPGDLVFFKGTYDTPGMSLCGIYLGNGMMVSACDPIKYANIHSSYWQQYLAGFGRLSK